MNGTSVLVRETPERGHKVSEPGSGISPDTESADTFTSDF